MFIALLTLANCVLNNHYWYCENSNHEWVKKSNIVSLEDFHYRYYYAGSKDYNGCILKLSTHRWPVMVRQSCKDLANE